MKYLHESKKIELWANEFWAKNKINSCGVDQKKEKFVVLDFFPYPSGVGLHVGHTLGYIATDIFSRFQKLNGKNVLYAMGFDAFGLPAEQFSIETGLHPEIITKKNIENMKKQLSRLGLAHDTNRSFNTTDSNYYRWTQWIFLKLYNSYYDRSLKKARPIQELENKLINAGMNEREIKEKLEEKRLAFLSEIEVNWCPELGTVLADEEVINGRSERGNFPVFKKPLKQWVLRITEYARRLLDNLELLDWPSGIKEMQKNWIGLSNGINITFQGQQEIKVFTTRAETLSGVTFLAISPRHPKINLIAKSKESINWLNQQDRTKGVFSGSFAIHPISGKEIPIYVADYVLHYGTGAVMGVPCHDARDHDFALENKIDFIPVLRPSKCWLQENEVELNDYLSEPQNYPAYDEYTGLLTGNNREDEIQSILKNSWAQVQENTKLRDWLFSRQRYWGEPFPVVYDAAGEVFALEESALPIELPHLDDYKPEAFESDIDIKKPLDRAAEWKNVNGIKLDLHSVKIVQEPEGSEVERDGKFYKVEKFTRETNTMPNWAGSCWYYLRYFDPKNNEVFVSKANENYWGKGQGAVDLYLGGAEHAVLHLLYARFWHMVLHDLGYVSAQEPFKKLFNQGMITGTAYHDARGVYIDPQEVVFKEGKPYAKDGRELIEQQGKLGKRYKNGVPPEEICDLYSADVLRLHMMYLGPLEQSKPWNYEAIKGMARLCEKVFALSKNIKNEEPSKEILFSFNETIKKITQDCADLKFNTAIAAFIILINKMDFAPSNIWSGILKLFAPFAPHLCEYLFQQIHPNDSIFNQPWPKYHKIEQSLETIQIIVTVNGKKKGAIDVHAKINEEDLQKMVQAKMNIDGVEKFIVIKNQDGLPKLVNIVC